MTLKYTSLELLAFLLTNDIEEKKINLLNIILIENTQNSEVGRARTIS